MIIEIPELIMNISRIAKIAALIAVLCPLSSSSSFAQSNGAKVDETRTIIEKWVESRQLISKETSDWHEQKAIMTFKINLLKEEIEDLKKQIEDSRKDVSLADAKRSEMEAVENSLRSAAQVVEDIVPRYEQNLLRLSRSFPQPLLGKTKNLLAQIPSDPEKTTLTAGERINHILGILNEMGKFNGTVTVTSELREIDTGKTVEVKSLYLGLAQAYFVDSNQQYAKSGRLADGEWVWEEQNEHAHDIWTAIAMYENVVKPALFIKLPVTIN